MAGLDQSAELDEFGEAADLDAAPARQRHGLERDKTSIARYIEKRQRRLDSVVIDEKLSELSGRADGHAPAGRRRRHLARDATSSTQYAVRLRRDSGAIDEMVAELRQPAAPGQYLLGELDDVEGLDGVGGPIPEEGETDVGPGVYGQV